MGIMVEQIKQELAKYVIPEKAEFLPKFFQAHPGGYGEGDIFLGVTVPMQRKVAKMFYRRLSLGELEALLQEPVHEYRFTALAMLVYMYEKAETEEKRREIVELYLANTDYINNWDLVDASADKILGPYLYDKDRSVLWELAQSGCLWQERISVIATFHFIKQGDFADTLKLAEFFLDHEHDLIHKAVGWMLREIGNLDFQTEFAFLKEHYQRMPRTMLRYAIEKFEPQLRRDFLQGLI
jgi:3-methyladenine DNA glycosylase AlkD